MGERSQFATLDNTKGAKIVRTVIVGKIVTRGLVAEFSATKTFKIPPLRTIDYAPAEAIKVLFIGVLFRTLPP